MSEIDEIRKTLAKHENRILDLEKLFKSKSDKIPINDERVVLNLISSGFFDKPKKYKDMIKELKSQATFNKKAKYTPILKKLTREAKLERKLAHNQWVYSKK